MDQGKYSYGIFIDLKKRLLRWIIEFFYLSPTITVLGMSCMTGLIHTFQTINKQHLLITLYQTKN